MSDAVPVPVLPPSTAFVLGGGGVLGAGEVGMLRALLEAGVVPDLVVGTSVGALNGAFLASAPTVATTERLEQVWRELSESGGVFAGSVGERLSTAVRSRTHLHRRGPLRELLATHLPVERIEDLQVPFQCVAAAVERAAEHWFTEGPLVDAVLASAAVPGLLAPVRIGEEHYLDGGRVNSIPVSRAVELGATTVWVLQVGRVDQPLRVPTRLVVGDGDPVASPALLEGAPPEVEVEVLRGVGHFVPEEAPQAVAERVRALFA